MHWCANRHDYINCYTCIRNIGDFIKKTLDLYTLLFVYLVFVSLAEVREANGNQFGKKLK